MFVPWNIFKSSTNPFLKFIHRLTVSNFSIQGIEWNEKITALVISTVRYHPFMKFHKVDTYTRGKILQTLNEES